MKGIKHEGEMEGGITAEQKREGKHSTEVQKKQIVPTNFEGRNTYLNTERRGQSNRASVSNERPKEQTPESKKEAETKEQRTNDKH